jgi:hypothetical protein
MSKSKSLEQYIEQATQNINDDRAVANKLLLELVQEMAQSKDNKYIHKDFGEVATRYLETLQRSNEQLVKIASIIQKRDGVQDTLSSKERDEIFDAIKGE